MNIYQKNGKNYACDLLRLKLSKLNEIASSFFGKLHTIGKVTSYMDPRKDKRPPRVFLFFVKIKLSLCLWFS